MKLNKIFIIIGALALISLACSIPGVPGLRATNTAVPTITSIPSQTPFPTETNIPEVLFTPTTILQTNPTEIATSQIESSANNQSGNQDISIISDNSFTVDPYDYIVGIIQNNTSNTIEYIDLSVLIYDANKALIATENVYPFLDKIGPGETTPFTVYSDSWTNGETYDFLIEDYDISDEPPPDGMVILSHNSQSDDFSLYLLGEIQNNSDVSMSYVKVVGTIYSADGTLLNANYMYATISNIPPGGKSPFKIWFSENWQDTETYEISVQGYHDEYSTAQAMQVTDYQITTDDYSCTITGNVKNNGTAEVTYATVVVVYYDSANTVIETEWNYTTNDSIIVGSSSPFTITSYSCPAYDHLEVYAGN